MGWGWRTLLQSRSPGSVGSVPSDWAVALRITRFRETVHGVAYAPRSCVARMRAAGDLRFPLHARYPATGG
jgi:hypothetical protein